MLILASDWCSLGVLTYMLVSGGREPFWEGNDVRSGHMRIKWSVDNNDITIQGHQEHSAQGPRLLGPRVQEGFSECQELYWRPAEQEMPRQTQCKESSKP